MNPIPAMVIGRSATPERDGTPMTAMERTVVGVLVAGFTIGTLTHTLHLVTVGWIVFDHAPVWMNVYWTALTALDPPAALLLWRRPIGLALGVTIILSDVAINSHALYGLAYPSGSCRSSSRPCSTDSCSAQPDF